MNNKIHHFSFKLLFLALSISYLTPALSATKLNLRQQSYANIENYLQNKTMPMTAQQHAKGTRLQKINESTDSNQTTHTRYQQTYAGYPVFGGQAIVHKHKTNHQNVHTTSAIPQTTMNGYLYQNLNDDLKTYPQSIFKPASAKKAIQIMQKKLERQTKLHQFKNPKSILIVYVDQNKKAHWAFHISFTVSNPKKRPKQPHFIVDATSGIIYKQWDNIQTLNTAQGDGYGGNSRTGLYEYGHEYPYLKISRNPKTSTCYLSNKDVVVKDMRKNGQTFQFLCKNDENQKRSAYFDGYDKVNGAYSPSNDALYAGRIIKNLYRNWYGIDALKNEDGSPMKLIMNVHYGDQYGNAFWDGETMTFGDGDDMLYPLVTLGIAAHEISHGFTEQHSNLNYFDQSGALNESFSDMAAQAADYYSQGENHWMIGENALKNEKALRYMDQPENDNYSISHINQYDGLIDKINSYSQDEDDRQSMIVHWASGVYNKFFYLLATSEGWNTHKAFDVVVQANRYYWTPSTDFQDAACGILNATADLSKRDPRYQINDVNMALSGIGMTKTNC